MATLILPADSAAPWFDFSVELEGSAFTFEFQWNARASAWFLAASDAAGVTLVAARRVVLGVPLLGDAPNPALPPGTLWAVDTGATDTDPGRDDLGSRVVIVYVESTGA